MILLFSLLLFVSSFLIFFVELFIGKLLLPHFGGSPATWVTSLFFFQVALLVGYLAAHLIQKIPKLRFQYIVFAVLFLLSLLCIPIGISAGIEPGSGGFDTVFGVLSELALALGVPFVLLALNSPLLQSWFFRWSTDSDPYFLYAASNAGSVAGLLCFPLFFERYFVLQTLNVMWSVAFVALLLTIVVVTLVCGSRAGASQTEAGPVDAPAVTGKQRLHWMVCAAVPSSLLLGVTGYLSINIAPFPLLWVIPLTLYFLTFIVGFAGIGVGHFDRIARYTTIAIILIFVFLIFDIITYLSTLLAFHLGAFFLACYLCHLSLYRSRPQGSHLTDFYLCMSLGSVLGAMGNSLLAPVIFDSFVELPIAYLLVLPAALSYWDPEPLTFSIFKRKQIWGSFIFLALAGAVGLFVSGIPVSYQRLLVLPLCIPLLSLCTRPVSFALLLSVTWLTLSATQNMQSPVLFQNRNFFGSFAVRELQNESKTATLRYMYHGNTSHGGEIVSRRGACFPTTYYHPQGPLGELMQSLPLESSIKFDDVFAVGLGTGSTLCYGSEDQRWTFVELDPAVVRMAYNQELFTFAHSHKVGTLDMVTGDGRFEAAKLEDKSVDVVMIDAFSSDSIPVHLITNSAIELYLRKLREDGFIALHISNRYLDLRPIIANLGSGLNLDVYFKGTLNSNSMDESTFQYVTEWAVIAKKGSPINAVLERLKWERVVGKADQMWTDDFSNIFGIIKWK